MIFSIVVFCLSLKYNKLTDLVIRSYWNHPWTRIMYCLPLIIPKMQSLFDWRKHDLLKVSLFCVCFLCTVCFCDFREGKQEYSSRPLYFFLRAEILACFGTPCSSKVFSSLSLTNTFSYFAAARMLPVSGPGSQGLGSQGRRCQWSTGSLWSFLMTRMEDSLQKEKKHLVQPKKLYVYCVWSNP